MRVIIILVVLLVSGCSTPVPDPGVPMVAGAVDPPVRVLVRQWEGRVVVLTAIAEDGNIPLIIWRETDLDGFPLLYVAANKYVLVDHEQGEFTIDFKNRSRIE